MTRVNFGNFLDFCGKQTGKVSSAIPEWFFWKSWFLFHFVENNLAFNSMQKIGNITYAAKRSVAAKNVSFPRPNLILEPLKDRHIAQKSCKKLDPISRKNIKFWFKHNIFKFMGAPLKNWKINEHFVWKLSIHPLLKLVFIYANANRYHQLWDIISEAIHCLRMILEYELTTVRPVEIEQCMISSKLNP